MFKRFDPERNLWVDDPAGPGTVFRWREGVQKNFARREERMKDAPR